MALSRILYYNFKLNRNIHKDRDYIEKLREKKFRKLLKYSFRHSEFYRKYYQQHGIHPGDLDTIKINALPVIDKHIMMANFDELLIPPEITRAKVENFLESSPEPSKSLYNKYRVLHTSGTTGEIGYFIYNQAEWDFIKAISLRIFPHFKIKPHSYVYIGAVDGHYAGISLFLSPVNSLEGFIYKDYLVLDINTPLKNYIGALNKLDPDVITGYPTGIGMLADMQEAGKLYIKPETVIYGGEPLSYELEKRIKEIWGCEIINYYAASESLILGVERKDIDGFYLFDDVNYIEFRDDHILLTNLYNYTQPLIRYKMDDILIRKEKGGTWPFTKIERVIGRQEEVIWLKNDSGNIDFIHPIVIVELYVKGLEKYQFIQTGDDSFTFKSVISPQFDENEVVQKIDARLHEILKKKKMLNVDYHIIVVKDIPPDPESGKFNLIRKRK